MSERQVIQYDTRDDRRQLAALLARLSPGRRVGFVDGLAASCRPPCRVAARTRELAELARVDDSADARLTLALYMDMFALASHFNLDLTAALLRLERLVRSLR